MRLFRAFLLAGLAGGSAAARGQPLNAPSESIVVHGHRRHLVPAPMPDPTIRSPDERAQVARDPITGAPIAAFGSAYMDSSPMGGPGRGSETGGPFVAPSHP